MTTDKLYLELLLENRKFASELKKTKSQLDGFKRSAGALKGAMSGLFAGISFAAVLGSLKAASQAFETQRIAVESLNTALSNTNLVVDETSVKYQQYASALQGITNYGDEVIIQNTALLQSYVGNVEITEDLIKATLDFAAANQIDLKSAFSLVGKSISSGTNALSRYGIEIDTGAGKTDKMAQITDIMRQKFGGAATAAVTAGDQVQNAWGDFLESLNINLETMQIGLTWIIRALTEAVERVKVLGSMLANPKKWGELIKNGFDPGFLGGQIVDIFEETKKRTVNDWVKIQQSRNKSKGVTPSLGVDYQAPGSYLKDIEKAADEEVKIVEDKNEKIKDSNQDTVEDIIDSHKRAQVEILNVSETFSDAITRNLDGLLDGTKSWSDVFRDVSRDIVKTFLQALITGGAGGGGTAGGGGLGQVLGGLFGGGSSNIIGPNPGEPGWPGGGTFPYPGGQYPFPGGEEMKTQEELFYELVEEVRLIRESVAGTNEELKRNTDATVNKWEELAKNFTDWKGSLNNVLNRLYDEIFNPGPYNGGEFPQPGQSSGGIFGGIARGIVSSALGGAFGGFFAEGGNPPVGKPSIVGEYGPELFIPKASGTVVPNGGFGGETNQTFVYAPQVRTSVNKQELMSVLKESSREFYNFVGEGVESNYGLRNAVKRQK